MSSDNTAANVAVGKPKITGAIYRAAAGTTVPTDTTTALASAFACVGYISADGVTNSTARTTTSIKAWGGDVVADVQTEKVDTFAFTMIEAHNINVQKTAHGDTNVTGALSTGLTITENSKDLEKHAWVIDMVENSVAHRICIPDGKITNIGDVTYKDDTAISYPVTLSAYPDSSGNTHYEYMKTSS